MTILINTDHNAHLGADTRATFTANIEESLSRFSDHLTRVEVHFNDENGAKQGINDKRCNIEARLEGMQPIVATTHANDFSTGLHAALDILKKNISKAREKATSH